MRSRPWRAALLVCLVAATCARAQANHSEAWLTDLLAAFDQNYAPSAQLQDTEWQVATLRQQLEHEALPRLAFTERVTWNEFSQLGLELDLSATVPLYRSRSEPLTALQAQRELLNRTEAGFARQEARNRFTRDLLALALLRQVHQYLTAALHGATAAGWQQPRRAEDALTLSPELRELALVYGGVESVQLVVQQQVLELERQVADALGASGPPGDVPTFEALASHALPSPTPLSTCLARSPLLKQADHHHDLVALELAAQNALDVRVELHGGLHYAAGAGGFGSFGGSPNQLGATIGLEARVPLPATWPVGGQLGLTLDPARAEQSLRLNWPPPEPLARPRTAEELAAAREIERAAVVRELRTALEAAEAAAAEVHLAEVQLLWAAADLHGSAASATGSAADLAAARSLANTPVTDPFGELQRVRYWSELAFARLTHAEQLLTVALVCGLNG